MENTTQKPVPQKMSINQTLIVVFLLALILIAGGYFRFLNLNWDEGYHLHPDERFLSMVLNSIRPVSSIKEYFNTPTSSAEPEYPWVFLFVYGTFPLFLIRYVGEWIGQVGYDLLHWLAGRCPLFRSVYRDSVFLIGFKLYNRRVGLIAAAFYALPFSLSSKRIS